MRTTTTARAAGRLHHVRPASLLLLTVACTAGPRALDVRLRGQLVAVQDADTFPVARSEVRLPAARARAQTDSGGEFVLAFRSPPGCLVLFAYQLQYRVKISSPGRLDLGTIHVATSGTDPQLSPATTLGTCDPGQTTHDYDWIVAAADLNGHVRYASGTPITGQRLIVRCLGTLPEPYVPASQQTHPTVIITDAQPRTDSLGNYTAQLRIPVSRETWAQSLDSVPCNLIVWRVPFDSVRTRVRFTPGEVTRSPIRVDVIIP